MRGNPEAHQLVHVSNLAEALALLADASSEWMPLAGGTELMVAHAAGRLTASNLINIWGVRELGGITAQEEYVTLGGGVTFGELRQHPVIRADFSLLARAAGWIGAIANQNRATLAGNIVNGSPAADAPPALLVYDAEIELISQNGRRRIPYADFHTGYKRSVIRRDELVLAIHLPRRFGNHAQYLRKVGTRRAMAITKVALAATAVVLKGKVSEVRLAAASVADRPIRLLATEEVLAGATLTSETLRAARLALINEVRPIDDIRSTAEYRRQVIANLLNEFLSDLSSKGVTS